MEDFPDQLNISTRHWTAGCRRCRRWHICFVHQDGRLGEQEIGLVGEHYDGDGDPCQGEHEAKDTDVELSKKYQCDTIGEEVLTSGSWGSQSRHCS